MFVRFPYFDAELQCFVTDKPPVGLGWRKTSNVIRVSFEESERAATLWLMDIGVMIFVLESVNSMECEL